MSAIARIFILLLLTVTAGARADQAGSVDVTRATLANGLQIVVVRDTLAPVVATSMNYLTGSDEEPISGIAHAQEHMLFRGSNTLSASQFSDTASITGGAFNGDTRGEMTQYTFEVPSAYLDIALNLERSRATGILDSQDLWNQERGAITQEVTKENSRATFRLYQQMIAHLFAGTPYAHYGLGTVASFRQIQAPDLKAFYRHWYHPNNAILVIAGNVDPQAAIAKVRTLFGNVPAAQLPQRRPVRLRPLTPLALHENGSDPVTIVTFAYRVPGFADKDYFASEILTDVLNSKRGALYALQASGKALQTFAESRTYPKAGMTLVGSAVAAGADGHAALRDVAAAIDGYKRNGVPPELVDAAKRSEVAQAQFARNSISGLAALWSQTLAVEHRTPDDDLAGIERVTVADVNRVLRRYFDEKTATTAMLSPAKAAGAAPDVSNVEDNAVVPTAHIGLPPFATRVLANLEVPASTVHPVEERLPNGLRLIVVQSAVSHTVIVRGQVLGDAQIQEPAGKEGVEKIVEGLFPYGTTSYDRLAFQAQLDKISANVSAGRAFGLDVLADDFDRGVELLADAELHPALAQRDFDVVKQQTIGALQGEIGSPDYKAQTALSAALYPAADPARRAATPQSLGSVGLADAKSYYAAAYRPDLTTIVVVGDVTPDRARDSIEHWFGAWSAPGPTPDVYKPVAPPNAAAQTTIPAVGRLQTQVTLAENVPIGNNDPDVVSLRLANTVLSGEFYVSLLYRDLREVHGYAYAITSGLDTDRNRSTFSITFGADPQNVAPATQLAIGDVTSLQSAPLSADQLTHAKALLLSQLPIQRESYDGLAWQLLNFAGAGQPLNQDVIDAQQALAATPESVRAAMSKWIRPLDFVRIEIGPAGN